MSIAEGLLLELEQECATARKFLERYPKGRDGWKPHDKSYTLQQLASHVAEVLSWTAPTLLQQEIDINPPGGEPFTPFLARDREAMLEAFDANVKASLEALPQVPDSAWGETWALKSGGETLMAMPRMAVYRGFIVSHLVHHRAQLGVYYRMLDIPVPGSYGPTADEPQGFAG